jgi:transposase
MQLWTEIRRRVLAEGLSKRQACREYGLHWHTLTKILTHAEPPGYRRAGPRRKPKLEPFLPFIHEILKQDQQAPRKQRPRDQARATHGEIVHVAATAALTRLREQNAAKAG